MHKHNETHGNHMDWMMLMCAVPMIVLLVSGEASGKLTIVLVIGLGIFLLGHFWPMIKKLYH